MAVAVERNAGQVPPPLVAVPVPGVEPGAWAAEGGGAGAVLRAVLGRGPVGRTELGRLTGLSPAAVSRHTAALADLGMLRQLPPPARPPRAGRPQLPVDIDTAHHVALGVHIGVPWVTFALVDLRGWVITERRYPREGDAAEVLAGIRRRLPEFTARYTGGRSPLGLGVVTGGWVDPESGTVIEHAPLGWHDVPVREELSGAAGAGVRLPVHVDSHARALARAELLFGAGREHSELVHLFVGNVVDAAIATGGTVLRGHRSGAGDMAHMPLNGATELCGCGRRGCFQAAVSERRLAERAHAEHLIPAPDFTLLLVAAMEGRARALDLLRERLRLVAQATALLLDMINPSVLVLTEAAVIHLPQLLPEFHREVAALSHLCEDPARVVVPTSFGRRVLAVAAGATVLDAVYRQPMELRTVRRDGTRGGGVRDGARDGLRDAVRDGHRDRGKGRDRRPDRDGRAAG
ncbi:ROK family protein [Streptomyces sp. CA-111067]|uniref:ROK family protein n=1 Tax=Streptomyces sp. CA-111067 TaxID=3240046 RepID=UPI003D99D7D4